MSCQNVIHCHFTVMTPKGGCRCQLSFHCHDTAPYNLHGNNYLTKK